MKTNQILLSAVAIVLMSMTSCQKYPDGPMIDLHSKTERVANNWKVAEAFENGKNTTADFEKYELELTKGGSASLTAKYRFLGTDIDFTSHGTWTFLSDKERISLDLDNNDAKGVYTILRLKEDEMWLRNENKTLELHFVTQ